ncbi:hypothetical protein QBC41DRAFT_234616 [Cercophora samala]|uniref:F-box domain-containing protein n=1 Tax=Cercophora samala TaxID=330535 RepID=A0AA40D7J1_9PEZI|nr:hypothetical protein QBC41DRAFT_234616 [Cercophora samala]
MEPSNTQHPPSPDSPEPIQCSLLRSLPNEMISAVICELGSVHDLVNLITTCRALYENFRCRKQHHLFCILQNSLGPVAPLAVFISYNGYNSAHIYDHEASSNTESWDKISLLACKHSSFVYENAKTPLRALVQQSRGDMKSICTDLYTMEFLVDLYIETRLQSFGLSKAACAQPSRTERMRVLMAFYRRQLLCNVWAPTERAKAMPSTWMVAYREEIIAISNTTMDEVDDDSSDIGRPLGLLEPFEEWEQQQIDHINVFVSRLCAALCIAADAHNSPIPENLLGEMMCKATSLVHYLRVNKTIADVAIAKVTCLPEALLDGPINRPGKDHPYLPLIDKYSLPFFISEWHLRRIRLCPDEVRGEGYYVRFTGDSLESPPFGWVNAFNEWCENWVGRTFAGEKGVVSDGYRDIADAYWWDEYPVAFFRVAGLSMWDRSRIYGIKRLPQLTMVGMLATGWAEVGPADVIPSQAYFDDSEESEFSWDDELDYNSHLDLEGDDSPAETSDVEEADEDDQQSDSEVSVGEWGFLDVASDQEASDAEEY